MNYNVYCVKIALAYNIYSVKIGGKMEKIYLATTYSHWFFFIRWLRCRRVTKVAATLIKKGFCVFSPITHSHPISLHMNNSMSYDFWLKQDVEYLQWCDKMVIYRQRGWDKSVGVYLEMLWCEQNNKQIVFIERGKHGLFNRARHNRTHK